MSSLSSETAAAEKIRNETEEKKQVPVAEGDSDDGAECEVNVRSEFKSCIDETISTVCRVASMKKKMQAEGKQ